MKNLISQTFSRRHLLKGAGVGLLSASLGYMSKAAYAQETDSGLPTALQRFDLGDASATLIEENQFNLPIDAFGGGAPEGAVAELLANWNLPTDGINASVTVAVVNLGDEIIMLDTGTGQNTAASLSAAGIAPENVTRVIMTHWHGDHVGGVSTDGALTFPNASHHFPQADWDFLQSADSDNAKGSLAKLQPIEDAGQLELYTAGELLPGIEAVATPGHTPGHHAISLSSGDSGFMYIGDAITHPVTALVHPEWAFGFDGDPEQASASRVELLESLSETGTRMIATHFPFPGAGFVTQMNDMFIFTPGS